MVRVIVGAALDKRRGSTEIWRISARDPARRCAVPVDESKVTDFVGVIDIGQVNMSSAAAWPADSVSNSNDTSSRDQSPGLHSR